MSEFIQQLVDLERSAPAVWRAALLSVKASLILALTALVVLALPRLSASKRHMIWAAGMVAALLLPFASLALPAWRLALRYSDSVAPNEVREPAPSTNARIVASTQASLERPRTEVPVLESVAGPLGESPDRNGAAALLALWVLGLAAAAWPWLAGIRARTRLADSASDLLPACWERSLTALRTEGHEPPRTRVFVADACTMPMTWGYARPIVLLPRHTHWSDDERRNALLHEFAHVRRADYLVKCTARLLCALHWFNPFVWLAARAERLAREEACDDAVLRAGSRPSLYAQQLFDIARRGAQPRFAVASLTMARQSNLARRLRSILAPALDRSPGGRRWPLASAFAVAIVLPPVAALTPEWMRVTAPSHAGQVSPLPATASSGSSVSAAAPAPRGAATRDLQNVRSVQSPQDNVCVPASGKRGSTSMHVNDSRSGLSSWRIKWSDGSCILELDARGKFTLSPNADDIVTLASGGHFELRHDDGRTERRVRLEPRSGGTMDREYTVNRRRTEWSDDAARWFAGALIALDRRTAFAVDARFPVLWQQGGFDAVQAEVERMPSAHARRVYYRKLFEQQPPTTAQITRLLAGAAPFFDSAHEAAELLLLVAKQPAFAEPAHLAYAQMARGIQSDYERRRALTALLARDDLKPEVVRTMLDATVGMKSDFELSELLLGIDRRYAVSDETRPYYLRALSTIGSNYEQRRVMSAVIRGDGLSAPVTGEIIGVAERTMKGYELAELLVGVADKGTLDAAASAAFLRATANVGSDYERRRVLNALLQRKDLPGAVVAGILAAAATIRSDFECAELLVTVARAVKIDDALRPSFDRAAATIDSEYEYGRAMAAARRSAAQ